MGNRRPWTDVDQSRATCNALDRYNTELRYDEEGPEDRADCWRCPVCKDRVSPIDGYACSCLYHAQAQLIEELRGLFANRNDRAVQDLCIEEECEDVYDRAYNGEYAYEEEWERWAREP